MNTLFVIKERYVMDNSCIFRGEGDIIHAPMTKHLENVDFDKYEKVIGVNLGLKIKTYVSEICKEKGIDFETWEGGKAWDIIQKRKEDLKREKFARQNNKSKEEKVNKWDFEGLKRELFNYGRHLYISINRPNNYHKPTIYESYIFSDSIRFNEVECFSDKSSLSNFIGGLELNTFNVYGFEKGEGRLLIYISDHDYLYIRKANIG